jgi:peptide/nickel transport system substrate-binding protein
MFNAVPAVVVLVTLRVLLVFGQGYPSAPVDALILPLGVEGTDYSELEEGVSGGILYVVVKNDPKSWNGTIAAETSTGWVTNRMHRGLLSYDPVGGGTALDFAKSRELSEDNLVLTFRLREGIMWSDGAPITADDVLFTFNDLILNEDIECIARDALTLPDGTFPVCEKVDDHTVTFTVSMVFRPLLDMLGFGLMPKHKLAQYVHRLNPAVPRGTFNGTWALDTPLDELVGNGPYVVADYEANTRIVMERNPFYYGYDASGTQLPYYDRIVAQIVPNEDTSLMKFRNGEIDVYSLRAHDIPILLPLSAANGFTILLTDVAGYGTRWFLINQDIGLAGGTDAAKRALYRNLEFRQALAHLIDKQTMVANVLNGRGVPLWSPVSVPSPFYAGRDSYGGPITEGNAVWYEYNPELAKLKLDALGVVDRDGDGWRDLPDRKPLRIVLNTSDSTTSIGICLIFHDDLRAVGLDVAFQVVEFNTLVGRLFAGTGDIIALGLAGGNDPNGTRAIYSSCGRLHTYRYSACSEPGPVDLRIDELFDLGAATLDLDTVFEYYAELQRLVAEQLGYVFTVQGSFEYAYYNYVGNASVSSPIATPDDVMGVLGSFCFDRRLLPNGD